MASSLFIVLSVHDASVNTTRNIGDCAGLQCVTEHMRQVEPEIHVPCRLSVGARNCTKIGGLPGFETHLVSGRKWMGSIAFFNCSVGIAAQAIWIAQKVQSVLQGECGRLKPEVHVPLPALGWCPKLHQKWRPDQDLQLTLFLAENGRDSMASSLFTVLSVHDAFVYATERIWGLHKICSVLHGACGKSNRISMSLAGSLVGDQNGTKNGRRAGFETHLVSGRNWLGSIAFFTCSCGYAAQAIWIAQICSVLHGKCSRFEPEVHVPGRLLVGAPN